MNSPQTPQNIFPNWIRGLLLAATAYNILWGILIGWFPETFYQWVTETKNAAPSIIEWQGKAVLAMAAAYLACAIHPGKFWYLAFFGALTKLGGGIWFYYTILEQEVGKKGIFHLLMNDAIWIPFFVFIGFRALAYKKAKREMPPEEPA
ncbi:hypothetical protein [Roseivirga misakiensis]|uniref:Alkyl hydroperoxide reductase n=1 Tax=Roseivirga misakiensis TaxID=1563681 RepID=A0A1E5T708_9BACT|nr:hypothetical protein [Roseivirga misakiensis]OEK07150.1 hypothetical protein BFP71_05695 [Roseivirga misakiensis]